MRLVIGLPGDTECREAVDPLLMAVVIVVMPMVVVLKRFGGEAGSRAVWRLRQKRQHKNESECNSESGQLRGGSQQADSM